MRRFGLIGKTLKHSFSKNYFTNKYQTERISDCEYELFELNSISEFPELVKDSKLVGLNVTIPYKKEVIQFLDEIDEHAAKIDAVNTIKFLPDGKLKGYNTDYFGFKDSITDWPIKGTKALILGTGGASNAVKAALNDLDIPFQMISRSKSSDTISYDDLHDNKLLNDYHLIINTTPLGTFPNVDEKPDLPYSELTERHMLFDLVYNPDTTTFMQEGINAGCRVQNGYRMLVGQAEKSWEIWNA